MSRPRTPCWSPAELEILRKHYPLGGVEPVLRLLPHRTFAATHMKAHKLGLKTSFHGRAPKAKLDGADLDEAIRLREVEGWSFARIGARFGVAESSACNAVMIALCAVRGFTPAQRDEAGHLTAEGLERVRYALKRGLKGIDIQLRLGVSASCVAEQRRRYNRDLAARGKALLPPAGGGERYSGLKITREERRTVEALYLEGLGVLKIAERTGISKTSCTRIRERLARRLKRKGQCLPGCDLNGVRHVQAHSFRHVHPEQVNALRALLLDRVPVAHAATLVALGSCTAYDIRDALAAEMAAEDRQLPQPIRPGRRGHVAAGDPYWPPSGVKQLYAFRALLETMSFDDAKVRWRRDRADERRAEALRPKTFEDHLRQVAGGQARLVAVAPRIHLQPAYVQGAA